jgi:hypothetical protein
MVLEQLSVHNGKKWVIDLNIKKLKLYLLKLFQTVGRGDKRELWRG